MEKFLLFNLFPVYEHLVGRISISCAENMGMAPHHFTGDFVYHILHGKKTFL